ncbi:MAG TPA: efflux RND transporter periplasmic adaptor subunit, partial [Vicinamibacterales bacterium]|nr:efflux RND transporter periplasmic adaptor subunit [Vicinamibacterales bacterium]
MNRPLAVPVCVVLALGLTVRVAVGQSAPALETAKVVSQMLDKTVAIPADLTAYQGVNMHAKVTGFIEEMQVDRGSRVKQGQILATLSAPELQAQTAKAEAELQSARARQAEADARTVSARSTFERLKAAAQTPGVVAGNDVEIAERNLEAAQAQAEAMKSSVAAAAAAIKALKDLESYLVLRAPFDGVITERHVHPGSLVGPSGTPVVRIEQVSRLRLTVPVPETYVAGIKRGGRVSFTVSAFPDQPFAGIIARPAYSLDMKTRSMLVELDVSNSTETLAPGMFAEVQWPVSRSGSSLFVPTTSVVRTSERQFVVRVRNGVAEWVDVRRG